MKQSNTFLENLLDAPGPSGFEVRPAAIWRAEAEAFAESVITDVSGNTFAFVNPDGRPRIMIAGHIDEIGLQVTHIDEEGFLYVDAIGGWDPHVLVGQRVQILGRSGDVQGVVGKKAIHLIKAEERKKPLEIRHLWVDIGVSSSKEAGELGIRVGDPMVIDAKVVHLAGDLLASRAIDNRIGAYVALETLRLVAESNSKASVVAVATVQEEIGGNSGGGARSSAFTLEPNLALVVDVTFSTDIPNIEKKELGEHRLGGGPVLSRGSAAHPVVFDRLVEVAEAQGIPYTIQAAPRATRTDADSIYMSRGGIPTGLVSVPNRYMHSPNEIVSLTDLKNTAHLLAALIEDLGEEPDFTPR